MSELANSLEAYQLMPFRFRRLERTPDTVLVTSEAGEHAFLDESSFNQLVNLKPLNLGIADDLDARQILCRDDRSLAVRLLATKLRTRKSFLRHGPSLHIFVVTLSCDHSCAYCQVSRRIGSAEMPEGVAVAAVERMFESPSPDLTVEFQGGEPLLAFDRISQIVRLIEAATLMEGGVFGTHLLPRYITSTSARFSFCSTTIFTYRHRSTARPICTMETGRCQREIRTQELSKVSQRRGPLLASMALRR